MSDDEEHSESEFYYPDEYEFLDNGDLTETNNEQVGDRENEGNSQEEIETFVKEQKSAKHNKENSQRHENISSLFVINKQGR